MLSDASGCRDDMGRYWLIFIIEMLGRFARLLTKALPLTALAISSGFTLVIPRMTSPSPFTSSLPSFTHSSHPRIKFVRDLAAYVDRLLVRDRAVILFQLTGDSFIDEQVVRLAEDFLKGHAGEVSSDFEFIFLEERHGLTEEKDQEHYFILYGPNGERVINIDPYLNKNRQRPHVLPNRKPLHRRLVESVNIYREVGLENIANQLAAIENDPNYVALVANAAQDYQTTSAKGKLKAFEKNHQVKAKNLSKFIVKDQHVGKVLGVKKEGVFLLVADSDNLRKDFREKAQFFSISGKRVTAVHASTAVLEDIFIFPPVQKSLSPSQYVLNVYVNRNNSSEKLQSEIKAELSKEEYRKYPKALYYSSDVEQAAIYYQKNDYSSECLQAYQPNTTLPKDAIRNLLTNTFQYEYLLNNKSINSHHLQQWLKQCEEDKAEQHFPSEKPSEAWAQQITGEEYKTILQHPTDKVIYHYSHHCHGCKKFGGKFQQFAKARRHPIDFYRINNDNNKAEGVRNYNSTPVFVFYKQGSLHPFIYKMPIFTEQVFDSFLTITSQLKLIRPDSFEKHIQTRSAASDLVGKMLREQFGGQSSL